MYFGWDETGGRLVCLWLDITGGGGLVPDGFGYGKTEGDRIPLVWGEGSDSQIHNTFTWPVFPSKANAVRRPLDKGHVFHLNSYMHIVHKSKTNV